MEKFIRQALEEDLGRGDLFSKCFKNDFLSEGFVKAKDNGIFSGIEYAKELEKVCDIKIDFKKQDSDSFTYGEILATIKGSFTTLIKIERVLLNILQHSSGIATKTNEIFSLVKDSKLVLLDTRKTRPLLRNFEKYSTQNGGVINHRMGLDDCLMLKDTHLAHIKDITSFVKNARKKISWTSKIEIEVTNKQLALECFQAGVDIIMCDNMSPDEIKEIVDIRNKDYKEVLIEASGNITKDNILSYSQIGVDAISSGAVIHKAIWPDFSMSIKDNAT